MVALDVRTIPTFAAVLALSAAVSAQHWPQFRGTQSGTSTGSSAVPPDTWSEQQNIAWKIDVPGRSWSSPIVWGDHVFVTTAVNTKAPVQAVRPTSDYISRSIGGTMTGADISRSADEHRWILFDIELQTGKVRWQRTLHTAVPGETVHQKNSFASETPATDGERVYVYLGYAGLFAFDFAGTPVWQKPMPAPKMRMGWGTAASPVLHAGRLYIVNDNEERSWLAAFDARSGAEVWRVTRDEKSNWSTPFVWQHDGRTEIVTTGSQRVQSYDTDGRPLWSVAGMTMIHATTPIAGHGLLFASSGYFTDPVRPVYAIKPGAWGDVSLKKGETSNNFVAWSNPTLASQYPSPLIVGDIYYTVMDRGFITATDARTGREIYGRQRISAESSGFSASPWSYGGRIFAISEDGDTFVIQAGPEFKLLGKNTLSEMTLASPAIAGDSLIVRTATKLYRIARK